MLPDCHGELDRGTFFLFKTIKIAYWPGIQGTKLERLDCNASGEPTGTPSAYKILLDLVRVAVGLSKCQSELAKRLQIIVI